MTFQHIKAAIILATFLVWGRLTISLVQLLVLRISSHWTTPTVVSRTIRQDTMSSTEKSVIVVSCQVTPIDKQP